MAGHPLIRPGDINRATPRAKRLAKRHLIKFGKADMAKVINTKHQKYGPAAVKGVKYIQRRYKLTVDGIIGPNTWKVLEYARVRPRVPVLTIMSRNQWAARTPRGVERVVWTSKTPTRVHHTDTGMPTGSGKALIESEKNIMRAIQKYHMDNRKYADIAYNFIIMPSGRVYEGRGKAVQGAHTYGHNKDCGIAFVGDYGTDKLNTKQVLAYKLLRRKMGVAGGKAYPHSDTSNTSCPGDNIEKRLGL